MSILALFSVGIEAHDIPTVRRMRVVLRGNGLPEYPPDIHFCVPRRQYSAE